MDASNVRPITVRRLFNSGPGDLDESIGSALLSSWTVFYEGQRLLLYCYIVSRYIMPLRVGYGEIQKR